MNIIPRRSVLYLPAINSRAIEKSRRLSADTIILDLEDSVAPDKKVAARNNLVAELADGGFVDKEVVVRVNALDSPWGVADVKALAPTAAAAICLPKVETSAQVHALIALLDAHGGCDKSLWVMTETPLGVINVDAVLGASERVSVLLMGTSDLAKELRIPVTVAREGMQYALQRCVVAARAAGIDIIDGVFVDLEDEAGLRAACEQGRLLGFDGKSLIHPKQLGAANDAFSPAPAEVEQAEKLIAAWQDSADDEAGVIVVDGKLVEQLHVDAAKRLLALHRQITQRAI